MNKFRPKIKWMSLSITALLISSVGLCNIAQAEEEADPTAISPESGMIGPGEDAPAAPEEAAAGDDAPAAPEEAAAGDDAPAASDDSGMADAEPAMPEDDSGDDSSTPTPSPVPEPAMPEETIPEATDPSATSPESGAVEAGAGAVPLPAGVWLFLTGMIGLRAFTRKRK
ncbi:MAG: VPLPA-CTERM sorting domain-containing protein [Methylococcaceae bacterium]